MGDVKEFRPPWLDGLTVDQSMCLVRLWAKVTGDECMCKIAHGYLCTRCDALTRFAVSFPKINKTLSTPAETTTP